MYSLLYLPRMGKGSPWDREKLMLSAYFLQHFRRNCVTLLHKYDIGIIAGYLFQELVEMEKKNE